MIMYAYQLVRKNSDIFKLSILFYLYSRMKISIMQFALQITMSLKYDGI